MDLLDQRFMRDNPGRPDNDPRRAFLVTELQQQFGSAAVSPQPTRDGMATFWTTPDNLQPILRHLKSNVARPYRMLYDLSAVDERQRTNRPGQPAADFTVVDTVPTTQTVYVPQGHLAASNPFLLEAERIVRDAGDTPLSAQQLAQALGASERTLHRRLKQASGETPKGFIDRVRFETTRMLLETTAQSIKQLAASSGYSDETSFRRAFHRYSGMTPGAYRSWARARTVASSSK